MENNITNLILVKFEYLMSPSVAKAIREMLDSKDKTVLIDLQAYGSLLPFDPKTGPDKDATNLIGQLREHLGTMIKVSDDCRERLYKLLAKYPEHGTVIKKVLTVLDLPDNVEIEGSSDFEFRSILRQINDRTDIVEINEIFIFINKMLISE